MGFTRKRRSRITASNRSSTSASKACFATHASGKHLTERIGFWIHLDQAYVTYHQSYVESVWWSLKNLFDRGLLYQGHKIVWWWAQGGTALSSGEGRRRLPRSGRSERLRSLSALLDDPDIRICSSGRPPPGPCRATSSLPSIRNWNTPSLAFEGGGSRNLIIASALVETIAGKVGKEFNMSAPR